MNAHRYSSIELHAQPLPSVKLKADLGLKHAEFLLIFTHSTLIVTYLNLYNVVKQTKQATCNPAGSMLVSRSLLSPPSGHKGSHLLLEDYRLRN